MTSNINPNIDASYPVAGVDNNSQGFRDNFSKINTNFSTAGTEISDLQNKVLLKSQLTGGGIVNNDLNHSTLISNAVTLNFTEQFFEYGVSTFVGNVDFTLGSIQKFTSNSAISLISLINPPTSNYAKLRLWANVTNTAHTITFPATIKYGVSDVIGFTAGTGGTHVFTAPTTGDYIFELATVDGGANYSIETIIGTHAATVSSLGTANAANITLLQNADVAITSNISTLQGNIVTINGEIGTINANISTLNGYHTSDLNAILALQGNDATFTTQISTINNTLSSNVVINNASNNMHGNIIGAISGLSTSAGATIGNVVIDATSTDYHSVSATGNIALQFTWPITGPAYSKIRVLAVMPSGMTITFPTEIVSGSGLSMISNIANVQTISGQTLTNTTVSSGQFLFEFSKDNSNALNPVFVRELIHP